MSDREQRNLTTEYINRVQNMIENCLQMYMNRIETVSTLVQQANIEPDVTKLVWQKLEEQNEDFFKAYHVRLLVKKQILMFNHLLKQQVDTMKMVDAMENVHAPGFTSVPLCSGFSISTSSPRHENMFVRPGAANTNVMKNTVPFRTQHIQQYNHGINGRALDANAMTKSAPFGNQSVHEYNHGVSGGELNANVPINTPFQNQSKRYNHDVFGRESKPNATINSKPFVNHGFAQYNHGVSGVVESNVDLMINGIPFRNQGIQHSNHGASGGSNANVMINNTSFGKQCIQQSNNGDRGGELELANVMIKIKAFGNQGIQHINHGSSGGEWNANTMIQSTPFGNQGFHHKNHGYSGGELNANMMIKNTAFGNQGIHHINHGVSDVSNGSTMINSPSTGDQGIQHFNFGINETLLNAQNVYSNNLGSSSCTGTSSSQTSYGVLPDAAFNNFDFDSKPSKLTILDQMCQSVSFSSLTDPAQNHGNFEGYGSSSFFQNDSSGYLDS